MRSLTGSNNSSPPSTSLRTTTPKCENHPQPTHPQFLSIPIKVRHQRTSRLEGARLARVRWVPDSQDRLEPAGAGGDGTAVDEGVEAGFASVGAVAALADTAEGEGGDV